MVNGRLIAQENTPLLCSNGIDDDGDGYIDCDDEDCDCTSCITTPIIYTGDNSLWEVSDILFDEPFEVPLSSFPLPNNPSIVWNEASSINPCSPNWTNPQNFPPPLNKGNWITHPSDEDCNGVINNSYFFYKTRFFLPCSCSGQPIGSDSVFKIKLDVYADNKILAIYVNDILQNVPNLNITTHSSPTSIELSSSWLPWENSITFLTHNFPWTSGVNPQGFLCVLSSNSDIDNDGVNDYLDLCLCENNSILDTTFIFQTTTNPVDTGIVTSSFVTSYGCDSTIVISTTLEKNTNCPFDISTQPSCENVSNGQITIENIAEFESVYLDNSLVPFNGIISGLAAGSYTMSAINSNGCTEEVQIDVVLYEELEVLWPEIEVGCEGVPLSLIPNVISHAGSLSYLWNNGSNNPQIDVNEADAHSVTISDACDEVSYSWDVEFFSRLDKNSIFTPNLLMPKLGNENSCFFIGIPNYIELIEFELALYDKWGNQMFKTEDPEDCWDGKFDGSYAAQGVYVSVARITFLECGLLKQIERVSDVTLIY